jgi:hypothetical protein
MNIDFVSQMTFGDERALHDFLLVHRFVHAAVGAALQQRGASGLASATIDSDAAATDWVALMHGEAPPSGAHALADWLQLHANLHQAEYDALRAGQAPDLGSVDFSNPGQFYEWMAAHQAVHDQVGALAGVT